MIGIQHVRWDCTLKLFSAMFWIRSVSSLALIFLNVFRVHLHEVHNQLADNESKTLDICLDCRRSSLVQELHIGGHIV